MSFKIFTLQLLGKIKPVEKIELQRKMLFDDYQEFLRVEQSAELKELLDLEKYIQSPDYKKRKDELQHLKFRGSKEEALLREYEKLKKSGHLKKYFKLKDSADLKRFEALKVSEKFKEYRELGEFVENGVFKKEKEEVKRQVFKGSEEHQQEQEYNRLKKSKGIKVYYELHRSEKITRHESVAKSDKLKKYIDLKNLPDKDKQKKKELKNLLYDGEIKNYLKFEKSKKLRIFRDTADSYNLKRFEELKGIVETDDFRKRVAHLKDKKKFEKTSAFKKWKRWKELSASNDIRFFSKFEKSSLLRNYYDVKESPDLKRFLELKEIISSDEYLKRKAYLEDPKKWEKSEEYSAGQKYREMMSHPHIVKYFKYKGTDAFDFFKNWKVTFEDDFSDSRLKAEKWSTLSLTAEKALGKNFSMPGDLHVFTDGKNVSTAGKLVIETRKEKTGGMVWKMPAGFVPHTFDYTSGLVTTAKSFWQEDGIFEAKVKFNPVKEVVHIFALQGEKLSPRLHLVEMGTKNRIGLAETSENGKVKVNGLDISNLKKRNWYIFTIEKAGGNLSWKINDTEVLKTEHRYIDFPLHIFMQSIVVENVPGSKLPVRFQVDWVKCYKKI
ncbi:MAG TPA: hypothetical protein ENN90_14920 [Mariniphaga anaerophila]|uniref:GH16 domain-containing protein n=1 Tax=Mariniphaga anaerophila TaxID=1484053 RepID=A0A831LNB3_9BACT|nr:hypothetical protein [Mariniphaga anaerophila]